MIWPVLFLVGFLLPQGDLFIRPAEDFLEVFARCSWLLGGSVLVFWVGIQFGKLVGSKVEQHLEIVREEYLIPMYHLNRQTYLCRGLNDFKNPCFSFSSLNRYSGRKYETEFSVYEAGEIIIRPIKKNRSPQVIFEQKKFTHPLLNVLGIENKKIVRRIFRIPPDGYRDDLAETAKVTSSNEE